jgi:hypothetical protein
MSTLETYLAQLQQAFVAAQRFESLRRDGVARSRAAARVFSECYAETLAQRHPASRASVGPCSNRMPTNLER